MAAGQIARNPARRYQLPHGRRLKLGLIGAGHFGRFHALKLAAADRAQLIGVFDPDAERAKAVAWEAGAEVRPLAEILAAADAVIIAAPAEFHYELAARGAAGGQACAGGKADRRHAGTGGRAGGAGARCRAGVQVGHLERFSAAHGAVTAADGQAALYRGGADCPVQAARHRCFRDPRFDDSMIST